MKTIITARQVQDYHGDIPKGKSRIASIVTAIAKDRGLDVSGHIIIQQIGVEFCVDDGKEEVKVGS